ncbi:I78 family peptidase inhibitor [Amnibacterium endophyticum]|uniref:I78 family peptidase inhibitor n=1 Tax=Amnibacterium endophyticum TaxID=2109337 RepID=A0ABW4LDF2_9MICO
MAADAVTWVAQHGESLRGLPADEAAARVRDAGLSPRRIEPGAVVTLEFRPDRVDLHCGANGAVVAVRAG